MFEVKSKIELEDITYSLRTREEFIAKQIKEAKSKNRTDLVEDLHHELGRLQIIRQRAEGDKGLYEDDRRMMWFSDPSSGTD